MVRSQGKSKNASIPQKVLSVTSSSAKITSGRFLLFLSLSISLILFSLLITKLYSKINIAKVNGQTITRLEYYKELEKKSGAAVLDDLITQKIIYQEAKSKNITITSDQINSELNNIKQSIEAQGSTLDSVLAYQGVTYEQLLENIKIQLILESLLKDQINVTDEEIKDKYDQNKDVYGTDKTFDDLKNDIKFQIFQEKITNAYQTWIQDKKNSAAVEKYL